MAVAHADPPAVELSAAAPPPELPDGAEPPHAADVLHASGVPHAAAGVLHAAEAPPAAEEPHAAGVLHAGVARATGLDAAALRVAALDGASMVLGSAALPAALSDEVRTNAVAAAGSHTAQALAAVEVGGEAPVGGGGGGLARGGEGVDGI
eukprot:2828125-Prymnesium_polylepis.1